MSGTRTNPYYRASPVRNFFDSTLTQEATDMSRNIFDDFLSRQTLFLNKEKLRHDHLPENLPHRDKEIEAIAFNLVEALNGQIPSNMTLYGVTGAGKTAVTKFVCNQLEEKGAEKNRAVR
jgi:cell division control protein 6